MSEKPDDAFDDDDDADDVAGASDDPDLERVTKELDRGRRREHREGTPAWRRLEQLREERRTAELTLDIEDYDVGVDDDPGARRRSARKPS